MDRMSNKLELYKSKTAIIKHRFSTMQHPTVGQDDDEEDERPRMTPAERLIFAEGVIYGLVQGIVAYFSFNCEAGLYNLIEAAFDMINHYAVWIPSNTMKFNMAFNSLFEAGNVVYTYCDISHFQNQITAYT